MSINTVEKNETSLTLDKKIQSERCVHYEN